MLSVRKYGNGLRKFAADAVIAYERQLACLPVYLKDQHGVDSGVRAEQIVSVR